MKLLKLASLVILVIIVSSALIGCGVSKNKYETLLNEKNALEEKLNLTAKLRDALLKDKMDLSTKVETLTNEKNALKSEYDKLLDEKIVLKSAYDKVSGSPDAKESQIKVDKKK